YFSYRMCIYDGGGLLTASSTDTNIQAKDSAGPTTLSAFDAVSGATDEGDIDLSWTYPGDTSDYDHFDIRALPGATAPNVDCTSDGSVLTTISNFATTDYTHAIGALDGAVYS